MNVAIWWPIRSGGDRLKTEPVEVASRRDWSHYCSQGDSILQEAGKFGRLQKQAEILGDSSFF